MDALGLMASDLAALRVTLTSGIVLCFGRKLHTSAIAWGPASDVPSVAIPVSAKKKRKGRAEREREKKRLAAAGLDPT